MSGANISGIIPLRDDGYQLEMGSDGQKMGNGDLIELQVGSTGTVPPQELVEKPTDSQQSSKPSADTDRGRFPYHETNSENHESDSARRRGQHPVPPSLFTALSLKLLLKLWGLRLCPETVDNDVQKALEEIHGELPIALQKLLCIGFWQFQANITESSVWEFYRFTFHPRLETEREELFKNMRGSWNDSTGENLTASEIELRWQGMISTIGDFLKEKLSEKQYCCLDCAVREPHSYNYLQRSVEQLETLDKNKTDERAKQLLVACMSLRVFDLIEEESGPSHHPEWKHHRLIVSGALEEIQGDKGLDKGLRAKFKDIAAYQNERLSKENLLKCLAELKFS